MSDYRSSPQSPGDHQAWEARMPFYLARTLPEHEARALKAHLSSCAMCRQSLDDWRAIANATHQVATQRGYEAPPLSPSLRQQVYHEAHQRTQGRQQTSASPLPPLRVMPRQVDQPSTAPSLKPAAPMPSVRAMPRRTSPWLTRIAAVFIFVIAAGIVVTMTRDRLSTLNDVPTQEVVMLNTATGTMTPQPEASVENTAEMTGQTEQIEIV